MIKSIRKATATALAGISATVIDSKVTPAAMKDLPVAVVFNKTFGIENHSMVGLGGTGEIEIQIDCVVAMSEDTYADTLDDLVDSVINTLFSDTQYLEGWNNVDSVSVSYQYITEYERPLAIGSITLSGNAFYAIEI